MTVSDGSLTATDTFTWTVSPPANIAPIVDSVTITPSVPLTDQTLTANVTSHDGNGDPLTTSYQWSRNGTPISGATSATLNLATAGNGDRGDLIRVTVSVNDGTVSSAPSTSNPVTVVNSAPDFSTDLGDRTDTVGDAVNLDADATDADGDTLTYSATNLPAGVTIAPATGVISGTLTAPAGTHSVTVTVSDTSGSDTDTFTWTVSPPANVPPVVDSASITPVAPVTDDTLTAQVASHDADGNTLTTSYQWSRNGTPIAGATGATLNLATAGNGDRGDLIRVTVSVNDGTVSSAPTTSDPVTIVNSPPVFSTDLADRSSDTVGDLVNLDADATDADGDAVTYSATDLPAGVTIAPATGVISGTLTAPAGTHSVTVTASDASGSDTDTFTWTVSPPANAAPVVDSVTIAPLLPATGQTLTATVTSHDAENSPLTTSYQWRRNTIDIVGATSSTLNLATAGNGDRGDQISVRVTVNDGQATSAPVTSDPVTVVNSSPVLTTDIQNRSNTVGDTVNLDADATDADADTLTYSATDLPAGVTIAPATGVISGTLTAPAGTHSVTVTVSDGTATATDTFTWTVAAANTAPVVDTVTIAPTSPTTGQTLTATVTSHDAEGSTLTTSYQWRRNGTDIVGQTGSTLNLATAGNGDRGDAITVRVTVNDGSLTSNPVTSSAVTVANSAPVFSTNFQDRSDAIGTSPGLDADATDADGDALTYSATGLPAGMSIAPASGVISGTLTAPAGPNSVTITVSDASGSATDTFTWTVTPPANTAPVVDSVTIAPDLAHHRSDADGHGDEPRRRGQHADDRPTSGAATAPTSWAQTGSTLNLATAGNGDRGRRSSGCA